MRPREAFSAASAAWVHHTLPQWLTRISLLGTSRGRSPRRTTLAPTAGVVDQRVDAAEGAASRRRSSSMQSPCTPTSQRRTRTVAPLARQLAATASSLSRWRAASTSATSLPPRSAHWRAISAPMPSDAPVMTMTFKSVAPRQWERRGVHQARTCESRLSAHCGRSRVSACGWLQRGAAGGARSGSSTRERQAGLACSAPCPPAPAFGRRLLLYLRRTRQPVLTLCRLYGIGCAGTCVGTLRWHWAGGGGNRLPQVKEETPAVRMASRDTEAAGCPPSSATRRPWLGSSTQYEGQQWAESGLPGNAGVRDRASQKQFHSWFASVTARSGWR